MLLGVLQFCLWRSTLLMVAATNRALWVCADLCRATVYWVASVAAAACAECVTSPAACSGYLAYEDIVKQLLDADYYAMYSPAGVDNTQV